ncbi:unnamed protein product [Rotaria magnacalcarata]|uniref:Uncharacterized protein n=1 Tax=Rotaria magnacalcarata TaxID=392030 RepID=A0A815L0Y2_9BILA|nr:unnamed protein product [Rotaria magnacalcarata]CAF1398115.1 unnamed protein product [Rotaria magnacalcarata]CAF2052649.1 unnamed protein product [Rotaria magnacalcarata]CAF2079893.1 unnamed protein product [Rotaria magnacalcarata]CAF2130062.1 unnamed protein product [Rotaria magnacalcarata]
MSRASSSRLHDKLEQCKQNKDFYEAHQICRTIYVRLRSSTSDENILKFLFESACYFLEHNQSNSGYDLCKCYVETLNRSSINDLTDNLLKEICILFQSLKPYHDERTEFACNVLRWSSQIPSDHQEDEQLPALRTESNSSLSTTLLSTLTESSSTTPSTKRLVYHKFGHPKLHQSFAHILWEQEKNYKDSRYHYLRSHDGRSFAIMLIEAHQAFGYPSEIDLFIAQSVLQYLLLRNFHTAYLVFVTYVEQHPKIRQPPPGPFSHGYPMLNFLWLLLLCLKKILIKTSINNIVSSGEPIHRSDAPPSSETTRCFSSLVNAYKLSLERDSTLVQYVDRIGALFFGLKQKSSTSSSNPFENLMNSLTANLSNGARGIQQQQSDLDLDVD